MDQLLKEFELLSLPSRVNLETISDDCVDKLLEIVELGKILEALKAKGDKATAFQWRKLREACLISRQRSASILIDVYEEAVKFNLKKCEMAECHIAISKLLDFYGQMGIYNKEFLSIIILFRFHYTGNVNEGLAEVSTILRQKIPFELLIDPYVRLALLVCKLAAGGNYWKIKTIRSDILCSPEISLLVDLIGESCKNNFVCYIIRAYPMISVSWIRTLLHSDDSVETLRELLASSDAGRCIELNDNDDKFILKKKK